MIKKHRNCKFSPLFAACRTACTLGTGKNRVVAKGRSQHPIGGLATSLAELAAKHQRYL